MTLEEIKSLDANGIEERKAAIFEEMTAEGADLDALTAEVDAIEERTKELKEAAEKRAALSAKVAERNDVIKANIVEEKTMEEKRTFTPL